MQFIIFLLLKEIKFQMVYTNYSSIFYIVFFSNIYLQYNEITPIQLVNIVLV